MAYKKFTLTEDHLKLIENIKFEKFVFDADNEHGQYGWGIDQYSLFGGSYAMEDIALIFGKYDQYIKGTEEDPLGKQYPKELEDYWWKLYYDIVENLELIISALFYYSSKGGLKVGTYKFNTNTLEWTMTN